MTPTLPKPTKNGAGTPEPEERPDRLKAVRAALKSAWQLAEDLRPVLPGPARLIAHATAIVQDCLNNVEQFYRKADAELEKETIRLETQAEQAQARIIQNEAKRAALKHERAPFCQSVGEAASILGIVVNPDTVTVETLTAALHRDTGSTPHSVPMPGKPGTAAGILLHVLRLLAPFFLSIIFSLGLASLAGVIPFSLLQNPEDITGTVAALAGAFWLLGMFLHHLLISTGRAVGSNYARAKFEGHIKELPEKLSQKRPAWFGASLLFLLWLIASLLEGYGLYRMAVERGVFDESTPAPLWLFLILGSVINGVIVTFASYVAFTDDCRELQTTWARQFDTASNLPLTDAEGEARQNLMAAACPLIDLNARIADITACINADKALLTEQPQISAALRRRIHQAENELAQAERLLHARVTYICRRMGHLPPLLRSGSIDLPTKMFWLPWLKSWHWKKDENEEEFPDE